MDAFVSAFVKPSATVLGRRLRPLCAWHVLLLEGVGSPFMRGELGGPGHLRLAVTICAQDPREIDEDASAAVDRIEREVASWWWRARTFWHSYPRELRTFVRYFRAHMHAPPTASTMAGGGSRRRASAPWVLGLVARAGGEPRHWRMPVDRLAWEIAARAEARAEVRFKSEEELAFEERVRARQAEAAAAAAGGGTDTPGE